MTHRLIYLVGQPGSGKSALMRRLTDPFDRIEVGRATPAQQEGYAVTVAHDALYLPDRLEGHSDLIGAEIGIQRGPFSGTDALPSSIIDRAVPWIETRPYSLLLAEGARLANARFIQAAHDAGYHVTLVLLDHAEQEGWRRQRSKQIGRIQNESWVKGRLTASRNLADHFEGTAVTVLRGHPDELYPQLAGMLHVTERG